MAVNVFDVVKSINETKKKILDDSTINQYNSFIVNRALSYFPDTIMLAQNMNINSSLDKDMQYSYLMASVSKRKRFSKWAKKDTHKDLELIQEYFQFSRSKAIQALKVLTDDQIKQIRKLSDKGGVNK